MCKFCKASCYLFDKTLKKVYKLYILDLKYIYLQSWSQISIYTYLQTKKKIKLTDASKWIKAYARWLNIK